MLVQVVDAEFNALMSYDDKCFVCPGSPWRRELMSRWVDIPGGRAVMAVNHQDDVVGYGCRRPAVAESEHHLIGPLYADSYDIAWELVQALTRDVAGQNIWINIAYVVFCVRYKIISFIGRQNAMHAEHDIVLPIPYVCLSNASIVSKRMDVSSHFFHNLHGRGIILVFSVPPPLPNSDGNPLSSGVKYVGWKNLQSSTEIAVYLGNCTR